MNIYQLLSEVYKLDNNHNNHENLIKYKFLSACLILNNYINNK